MYRLLLTASLFRPLRPAPRNCNLFRPVSTKMSELKEESSSRCFGGFQKTFSHYSESTKSRMIFSAYIPERAQEAKCPVLYYLSGMTCTEQNFIIKSGMQQHANRHGIIVIGPDTSPRGVHKPGDVPAELEAIKEGASWYLDAKCEPFLNHQMYTYVTKELPAIVEKNFNVIPDRKSVMGHSMGGHGALLSAFRNPGTYRSVSLIAPSTNLSDSSTYGKRALAAFLGGDENDWRKWDPYYLVVDYAGPPLSIRMDQGSADTLIHYSSTNRFAERASKNPHLKLNYQVHEGYDHSYFFVSSVIPQNFEFHASFLNA